MKKLLYIVALISFRIFVLAKVALAQQPGGNPPPTGGPSVIELPNPLKCKDIPCVAENIIDALFQISIPIVAIMVLVGGFQIMTASGDEKKLSTGKKTILYAVVGFAIVLIAEGVVGIIQSILGPK